MVIRVRGRRKVGVGLGSRLGLGVRGQGWVRVGSAVQGV